MNDAKIAKICILCRFWLVIQLKKTIFWKSDKRPFCPIIGKITGQNVQSLPHFAILASFLWGNLNCIYINSLTCEGTWEYHPCRCLGRQSLESEPCRMETGQFDVEVASAEPIPPVQTTWIPRDLREFWIGNRKFSAGYAWWDPESSICVLLSMGLRWS